MDSWKHLLDKINNLIHVNKLMNNEKGLRIKIYTHNDLDAVGTIAIHRCIRPQDILDIEWCNYKNINKKIFDFLKSDQDSNYDLILITDISVKETMANYLNSKIPKKVALFDHHETSGYLDKYDWVVHSISDGNSEATSATWIYYEFMKQLSGYNELTNAQAECLFNISRDIDYYDSWKWKPINHQFSVYLNHLMGAYGSRQEYADMLRSKVMDGKYELSPYESQYLHFEYRLMSKVITSKTLYPRKFKLLGKHEAAVVQSDQYPNEISDKLLNSDPTIEVAIIIGSYSISLRSRSGGVHVGHIAEQLGGGGHAGAAGISLPRDFMDSILGLLKLSD